VLDQMRIERWGVIGESRLTGMVHDRPGHSNGRMVVTSPVVEVQMMGGDTWPDSYPVAVTQSGSMYRLGRPSGSYGVKNAQRFVYSMLAGYTAPTELSARGADLERTVVMAAVDTTLHNFEHIEIDHTTFDTGWIRGA
jgi:hypothetical protein